MRFAIYDESSEETVSKILWSEEGISMRPLALLIALVAVVLAGCATIKTYSRLEQPVDTPMSTYVGGVVFKVDRSQDLPNVFGRADIFGGKVNKGFMELVYKGIGPNGNLLFGVVDEQTTSNETTMTRHSNTTADVTSETYGNTTTSTIVVHRPPKGETVALPPNTTNFAFDPKSGKNFTIDGIKVVLDKWTTTSFSYSLVDTGEPK